MGAHVGRDVKVEFALKAEALPKPAAGDYKILGMMRAKSINTTWDTVDTTADKSPNFTKTSLVTFKNVEFSGDGVSYDDEVHNQELLEKHVVSPPEETGFQPKVWFKITYPNGKVYEGPVVRILDFGAIINIMPGRDGLLHVSQIANERVNAVSDYLKEGQVVRVKVLETDEKGRVRLSMKALLNEKAE